METQHIIKIERILVNGKEVYVSQDSLMQQGNNSVLLFILGFVFLAAFLVFLYYKKKWQKINKRKSVSRKRKYRRKRKV